MPRSAANSVTARQPLMSVGSASSKPRGPTWSGGEAARGVVAHAGRAENLRDAHLVLQPLDLRLPVAAAAVEEIRADGVVGDLDAHAVALRLHLRRERQRRLALRQMERRELDHVEAHLLGFGDHVKLAHHAFTHQTMETVGTDTDFHVVFSLL